MGHADTLTRTLSALTPTYLFVLVRGGYRRPFTYGLLMTASVRPHSLSGHEADSLTCDHLSNCPSYCQNNPYNDETFYESFHTAITYLFGAIATTLQQIREKSPHFCEDSSVQVQLERETRIELATLCLGSKCSTTELLPLKGKVLVNIYSLYVNSANYI